LLAAFTRAQSSTEMAWRTARKNNDFASLEAPLREIIALVRRIADAKASKLGVTPYEALMDEYEPGARIARVDAVFSVLRAELPGLVDRIIERQGAAPAPADLRAGIALQQALARKLVEQVGFDFKRGRLDTSAHPFCGGSNEDVRITTRYDEQNVVSGMLSVLHETGHAMYEQGLPQSHRRQPVGYAVGMAAHESQSLIVEMQACRTPEFFEFFTKVAKEVLGSAAAHFEAETLRRASTRVARSLIRVEADEATYPLHVLVRYELERALVSGDLEVKDLPAAWRESMKRLVGIDVPDDRQGCLKDIHWPSGAVGYFPTYTMGAIAASQLFLAARRSAPQLLEALRQGDFAPLMTFLRNAVHSQGSLYDTDGLLTQATGGPLDARSLLSHLEARYLA
jgi:carboxypeptidase Taq